MPAFTRNRYRLTARQMSSGQLSIDSSDSMDDYLPVVDEQCEDPQKAVSHPSTPLGRAFSEEGFPHQLAITILDKSNLHHRYMSDEEEPSPSPDSESGSSTGLTDEEDEHDQEADDVEFKHKIPNQHVDDTIELQDSQAEIATAVPIMAMGPPKLVDIISIAPMRKRVRITLPVLSRPTLIKSAVGRKPVPVEKEITKRTDSKASNSSILDVSSPLPGLLESLPYTDTLEPTPGSWSPSDGEINSTVGEDPEDQDDELFSPSLQVHKVPTYEDYHPYSLHPSSSLSSRGNDEPHQKALMHFSSPGPRKPPGNAVRARKQPSSPSVTSNVSWRGLARTLSMAKRQEGAHPSLQQRDPKKPWMVAREPTDREEVPLIPPFPFEDKAGSLVAV